MRTFSRQREAHTTSRSRTPVVTLSTAAWNVARESSGFGSSGLRAPWNWNVSVAGSGQSAR